MHRSIRRVDGNQNSIAVALRKLGASVEIISSLGRGCPDLLVGYRNKNFLMEIKNPGLPPSQRALTSDEKCWHFRWRGQKAVVETIDQAIALISA